MCAPLCSAHLRYLSSQIHIIRTCGLLYSIRLLILLLLLLPPLLLLPFGLSLSFFYVFVRKRSKHTTINDEHIYILLCSCVRVADFKLTNWFKMVWLYDLWQMNNYFSTWHSVLNITLFIFQLGHAASERERDREYRVRNTILLSHHYFTHLCEALARTTLCLSTLLIAIRLYFCFVYFSFLLFSFVLIFAAGCVFWFIRPNHTNTHTHTVRVYISDLIVFVIDWLISIMDASTQSQQLYSNEREKKVYVRA